MFQNGAYDQGYTVCILLLCLSSFADEIILQSNFNGLNTFWTMKISSRHG